MGHKLGLRGPFGFQKGQRMVGRSALSEATPRFQHLERLEKQSAVPEGMKGFWASGERPESGSGLGRVVSSIGGEEVRCPFNYPGLQ